jgi:CDP-6-deoxy-D-xylo-4-hexulose-3-dehydrase
VGSLYRGKPTGSFGDLSTVSFYPAHHITMGEGGCVLSNNLALSRLVESFRDWGRDCWCEPGESNRCQKRFSYQLGDLPEGYDHKYIFSHRGYNLKSTDLQASLGLSQLERLTEFGLRRRQNWQRLRSGLDGVTELLLPSATPGSDPSWFGFAMTVQPGSALDPQELVQFLESRRIGTRRLFSGNLIRHPAYTDVSYRVSGELSNSDIASTNTFWVGVYPGLTDEMIDYVISSVREFVSSGGMPLRA